MGSLNKWFGYPIYITALQDFKKINKDIVPLINKDITPTNSQWARTTDVKPHELQAIDDAIHNDIRFAKLFTNIEEVIKEALLSQKYNLDLFEIYITKAWATYSLKDQSLHCHRHMSSHFSFVYYPYAEDQGDIVFVDDIQQKIGVNIPHKDPYFTSWDDSNFSNVKYPAKTGNVIIFPSTLFHETEVNKTDKPRISISGDILLTMKPGVKSEHNIPSPSTWRTI